MCRCRASTPPQRLVESRGDACARWERTKARGTERKSFIYCLLSRSTPQGLSDLGGGGGVINSKACVMDACRRGGFARRNAVQEGETDVADGSDFGEFLWFIRT